MKSQIVYIVVSLVIIMGLCACDERKHPTGNMLKAEKIVDFLPDSAKVLLEKDSLKKIGFNKSTRMYYDLLFTLASDFSDSNSVSDSLLVELSRYYLNKGTKQDRAMMLYLLGIEYTNIGISSEANNYFDKYISLYSEDNLRMEDSVRVNYRIGRILSGQYHQNIALPYLVKSYNGASSQKDTLAMIFALREKMCIQDFFVNRYSYFKEIMKLLDKCKRYSCLRTDICLYIVNDCISNDMKKEAKMIFLMADDGHQMVTNAYYSYVGGNVYKACHQIDSATFFYKKSMTLSKGYFRRGPAMMLYQIYRDKGNYKLACNYADSILDYTAKMENVSFSDNNDVMQTLYEKLQTDNENDSLRGSIFVIISLSLVLLISLLSLYYYLLRKHKREIREGRNMLLIAEQNRRISLSRIDENNNEITRLESQLEQMRDHADQLKLDAINAHKELLDIHNRQIILNLSEQEQRLLLFHHTDIYRCLCSKFEKPETYIKNDEWVELKVEFDKLYPEFMTRLRSLYENISEIEIRMSVLVKLDVPIGDLPHLLNRAKSSVGNMRKRLYKKLTKEEGSSIDFDGFVKTL